MKSPSMLSFPYSYAKAPLLPHNYSPVELGVLFKSSLACPLQLGRFRAGAEFRQAEAELEVETAPMGLPQGLFMKMPATI